MLDCFFTSRAQPAHACPCLHRWVAHWSTPSWRWFDCLGRRPHTIRQPRNDQARLRKARAVLPRSLLLHASHYEHAHTGAQDIECLEFLINLCIGRVRLKGFRATNGSAQSSGIYVLPFSSGSGRRGDRPLLKRRLSRLIRNRRIILVTGQTLEYMCRISCERLVTLNFANI